MSQSSNHLEIYKTLPRTNCGQCGIPSCLAFATAVVRGEKRLTACPDLAPETAAGLGGGDDSQPTETESMASALEETRAKVAKVNLASVAGRLGGTMEGDELAIPVLGKKFHIDAQGNIRSMAHVNPWISNPLLHYILTCRGIPPRGQWVPFRELAGGLNWGRFFHTRCEQPLHRVIDSHTDLLRHIVEVFGGRRAEAFDSDIAVVINPLPLVPMLICYWEPEDGMDSQLNLFFDSTATDNLIIDSIYFLGVGLLTMFEKIAQTHGR